jgi:hypothetical protein
MHRNTVCKVIKRFKNGQPLATSGVLPRGRARALQPSDLHALQRLVASDEVAYLDELQERLFAMAGKYVSLSTICRGLMALRLTRKQVRAATLRAEQRPPDLRLPGGAARSCIPGRARRASGSARSSSAAASTTSGGSSCGPTKVQWCAAPAQARVALRPALRARQRRARRYAAAVAVLHRLGRGTSAARLLCRSRSTRCRKAARPRGWRDRAQKHSLRRAAGAPTPTRPRHSVHQPLRPPHRQARPA